VWALTEGVSYLELALDKDARCAALRRDTWWGADLVQCQDRGAGKLSEGSKVRVEGK